ncbi:MAG TPA: PQQ-dependent sugar dehydrogenase [Bryobacteraceae bacterium]
MNLRMPATRANVILIACCLNVIAWQNPPSRGREVSRLYADTCARCHGADMAGGSASSLIDGAWQYGSDDAGISRSIRDGHPDRGMPAMSPSLNTAEIRALVIYIHERGAAFASEHSKWNAPSPGEIVNSEKESFKLESVLETGLETPWAIAFLPEGRMLVTERPGRLRIVEKGGLLSEPVRNTPAVYGGEGGLLDVALDPDYSQQGSDWIYLSYGDKSADGLGMTAVIRGRLRDGAFVDQQQIFKADLSLYRSKGLRFGSRLLFDGKGHLFFSIGDRGHPGDEQDLSRPNGKVYRVEKDGRVPAGNPFVNRPGALTSIWTYGHRNPQGLAFSPLTGELWEAEHGPRGGDELNILAPGHNYGWPVITYGMNYDGTPITDHTAQRGMDQPVTYWVPSIAASPIVFYTGQRFPHWKNNLFVGALAAQELRRLVIDGHSVTHQEIVFKGIGRVRDVVNGPDGYLYVVLNQPDRIERLAPARQ